MGLDRNAAYRIGNHKGVPNLIRRIGDLDRLLNNNRAPGGGTPEQGPHQKIHFHTSFYSI